VADDRPGAQPELFLDRSLGRHQVPAMLRAAGLSLRTLAEVYGIPADENIADVTWLERAGQERWIVLTKDQRVRYRDAELSPLVSLDRASHCVVGLPGSGGRACSPRRMAPTRIASLAG
jgi:hypothetical protein